MIKFLNKKLEDDEAAELICQNLDDIISVNEQMVAQIDSLMAQCEKSIKNGTGRPSSEAEDMVTMLSLSVSQKMLSKGREKEEKHWLKLKFGSDIKPFIKDVEKSVKLKDRAVREIRNASNSAFEKYSPENAKKWLDMYKGLVNWSLDIYKEQKIWAEENLKRDLEV